MQVLQNGVNSQPTDDIAVLCAHVFCDKDSEEDISDDEDNDDDGEEEEL